MPRPLAIDLYAGLGGWAEGLLTENYRVVGFDIERHEYGAHRYPAQLVIQDVLTLHGSQFRAAALIVASPPCQAYSWMAMPWKRAKARAAEIRADATGQKLADLNRLFDACFRIQAQASLAAGRHIPMVVENVRGAQPWVGRARWNYGSFYLWGDVPALMPFTTVRIFGDGLEAADDPRHKPGQDFTRIAGNQAIKNNGGSWFAVAHNTTSGKGQNPDGRKLAGFRFDGSGRSFQSAAVEGLKGVGPTYDPATGNGAHGMTRWTNPVEGVKQGGSGAAWWRDPLQERRKEATTMLRGPLIDGRKGIDGRSAIRNRDADPRPSHGNSSSRKAASAMIAKIPLPLARWIAAVHRPDAT